MNRFYTLFVLFSLAIANSCVRHAEPQATYALTQEGLVLQFENPSLKNADGSLVSYQAKVRSVRQTENGLEVIVNIASLQGVSEEGYLCQSDGAVYSLDSNSKVMSLVPPGFPYKNSVWQANGLNCRVIGRAKAQFLGVTLPDSTGVWVEAVPITASSVNGGGALRFFLLPGIGEAERWTLRQGEWVCTKKLTGRGFSDVF